MIAIHLSVPHPRPNCVTSAPSEASSRGAGCGSPARPDLWGPPGSRGLPDLNPMNPSDIRWGMRRHAQPRHLLAAELPLDRSTETLGPRSIYSGPYANSPLDAPEIPAFPPKHSRYLFHRRPTLDKSNILEPRNLSPHVITLLLRPIQIASSIPPDLSACRPRESAVGSQKLPDATPAAGNHPTSAFSRPA